MARKLKVGEPRPIRRPGHNRDHHLNKERLRTIKQPIEPLISVVVPVYNVVNSLEHCVKSITTQTYRNLEILLIDDGSTDFSGKLCDMLAQHDSRIRVFHQENQGLSAARNTGIEHLRGQYVTFVDSDDALQTDLVSYLYDLILREQAQISICSFDEVTIRNDKQPPKVASTIAPPTLSRRPFAQPTVREVQTFDRSAALQAMLLEQGFTMSAWSKLYAVDLFRTIRYPVGKLYEDVGTTYKLILGSERITFGNQPLYEYYQNPTSITKQAFSFRKLDLIDLTDQMCDDIMAKLPQLREVTRLRRMHARFSVLRQMNHLPQDQKMDYRRARCQITQYLRQHRADVLENSLATRRDRLAMYSLLFGRLPFSLAWKIYQHYRR